MGIFDTYGNVQLKAGVCMMKHYKIGDRVDVEDGVYLSTEGVVVVKDSIFIAEFAPLLFTKWGGVIEVSQVIEGLNPITVKTPFVSSGVHDELAPCQRHYEKSYRDDDFEKFLHDKMVDEACDRAWENFKS